MPIDLKDLARRGAEARLRELDAERADILSAFPDLRPVSTGRRSRTVANPDQPKPERKRRAMTAAQRKAVGERMKKYWAERRAAAKK